MVLILLHLLMGKCGQEVVEACCLVLSVKCEDANVNGCKILNFDAVTDGGVRKGMCWEMLHSIEHEMIRCKCKCLQDFKFSIQFIYAALFRDRKLSFLVV